MSNPAHFSALELFDLAIETERNGCAFYAAAAAAATDAAVQRTMAGLGRAEAEHEKMFVRLRDAASPAAAPVVLNETYAGEQMEYMLALLRARVLRDEATALQVVADMQSDDAALDFAIAFEKDTILFMQQMRELIPESDRESVAVLIQQEFSHVRLLQGLKDARA